jgi:hypothetical protein
MIQIDKDVPMPKEVRYNKYPWLEMAVGDSFFIPDGTKNYPSRVAGYATKRHAPKRFTARRVEGGTRVWRIA